MRTDFAQLRRLPDLLFPRRCPFCGSLLGPDALQGTVCPACVPEEMRLQHIPARLPEGEHDFYAVREAAAAYYYEDIVRTAVLRCKRAAAFGMPGSWRIVWPCWCSAHCRPNSPEKCRSMRV
ncbi:hypothetical protein NIA69_22415 [Gemmiger formicilis]|nr:hypothetical protein [Gemmiger formicilis]